MKNVLVVCTTDSMIWNFLVPHILDMIKMGMLVSCACSRTGFYFDELKEKYGLELYEIPFTRTPYSLKNVSAFGKLKSLANRLGIDTISCHEPVGGAMGRLVGRSLGCKVIYTAHGFHFYKGAPLHNWLIYYPIEKFLSRYTDVLITMNKEDYALSKTFHAKRVKYIHGIGIDVNKIYSTTAEKDKKRHELQIPQNARILLSVGELSKRKNHEVVVRALSEIDDKNVIYLICGEGQLDTYLEDLSKSLGVSGRVFFLGFRKDVIEVCKISDIFVFPSQQEGLPVALMEAMLCGLPVICTNIRGNSDLITNNVNGYCIQDPNDAFELRNMITKMLNDQGFMKQCGENNKKIASEYAIENSLKTMAEIYKSLS